MVLLDQRPHAPHCRRPRWQHHDISLKCKLPAWVSACAPSPSLSVRNPGAARGLCPTSRSTDRLKRGLSVHSRAARASGVCRPRKAVTGHGRPVEATLEWNSARPPAESPSRPPLAQAALAHAPGAGCHRFRGFRRGRPYCSAHPRSARLHPLASPPGTMSEPPASRNDPRTTGASGIALSPVRLRRRGRTSLAVGGVAGHHMPQQGKRHPSRQWPSWRSGRDPRRLNRRTPRPPPRAAGSVDDEFGAPEIVLTRHVVPARAAMSYSAVATSSPASGARRPVMPGRRVRS